MLEGATGSLHPPGCPGDLPACWQEERSTPADLTSQWAGQSAFPRLLELRRELQTAMDCKNQALCLPLRSGCNQGLSEGG